MLIQKYAQFWSFGAGSGSSFSTVLCMIFQEKSFTLYSINWPNFIVWLSLLFEILGNMCITIVSFSGCDVRNFEINLIFLIKLLFYMTKNLRQKFKYLENEKSFSGQIKNIFKGLSMAKCALKICFMTCSLNYISLKLGC